MPANSDISSELGLKFIEFYKLKFGDFKTSQPMGLIAFEALRLIKLWSEKKGPISQMLKNKVITDGAIKTYSFDEDGAVRGLDFKVFRVGQ